MYGVLYTMCGVTAGPQHSSLCSRGDCVITCLHLSPLGNELCVQPLAWMAPVAGAREHGGHLALRYLTAGPGYSACIWHQPWPHIIAGCLQLGGGERAAVQRQSLKQCWDLSVPPATEA